MTQLTVPRTSRLRLPSVPKPRLPQGLDAARNRFKRASERLGERVRPLLTRVRALLKPLSVVTGLGWVVLAGAALMIGLGLRFDWIEALAIGLVCAVATVIAIIWTLGGANFAATVEVDVNRVRVGDHLLGRLQVTNQGRPTLTGSLIELPVGRGMATFAVPRLGAQASHEQVFTVPTKRRAVINLGPVRSVKADPLGLLRRTRDWSEVVEVFVHPRTVLVEADTAGLLRDIEGITTHDLSSSDVAFHALRDYVPGDDRRAVHWRSTARLGRLIVRQFEETRKTHLLVVLSLNADEYATEEDFETAVSAAGSLVLQAAREDRAASLFTQDGLVQRKTPTLLLDELCRIEARSSRQDLPAVTLAAIEQVPDATVAALIAGAPVTPTQLMRAEANVPPETRAFAVRCDEASPAAIRRVGKMNVLSLATLEDLPRAARSV